MIRNKNELELYIHIPFCKQKCAYCDFLSTPAGDDVIETYVCALIEEIKAQSFYGKKTISTIFVGGGTPSILSPEQMKRIFEAVCDVFDIQEDAEITIEVNPGTVTREKLIAYRECGINRLSFGVQSTSDEELKLLGRIHIYEEFASNYMLARKCGFNNINVDLISAIPGQTIENWERSLRDIIMLAPEHISAYSLIIEEGTPFAEEYGVGCKNEHMLPSEENERRMYHVTEELLSAAGYHRYEISNYAKEGKECRHNIGYWERTPYLGLGLGAASLTEEDVRFHNVTNLKYYIEHSSELELIREDVEKLSAQEEMEEFIFLGLRKIEGISLEAFENTFGKSLDECYGVNIKKMIAQGFLEKVQGRLRLTRAGIDVSNQVFASVLYE